MSEDKTTHPDSGANPANPPVGAAAPRGPAAQPVTAKKTPATSPAGARASRALSARRGRTEAASGAEAALSPARSDPFQAVSRIWPD